MIIIIILRLYYLYNMYTHILLRDYYSYFGQSIVCHRDEKNKYKNAYLSVTHSFLHIFRCRAFASGRT